MRQVFYISMFVALSLFAANAQSPTPIIVQAASQATPPVTASLKAPETSDSLQAEIKILQEMKAKNGEVLKNQESTLERLDDLEKAAQQLKIFAHRTGG